MNSFGARTRSSFAGFVFVAGLVMLSARPASADGCDRACLGDLVTQYLNDMVSRNPGALPVTTNVRFTENGGVLKLGDGLWQTASGLGTYRQDILDVEEHIAATQAVVLEDGNKPVLFALRLKERGGKISEVETMVVRQDKSSLIFDPAGFQKGNEPMASVPPASEIDSRSEAIKIAMKYPQGLKIGSFVQAGTPFAADAYRIENGIHTAGAGCARAGCEDIKTQKIITHPGVRARVAAVDMHLGVVLLYLNFGNTKQYGPGRALVTFEAFKIYGGQIHAVNAILRMASATAGSGWGPERPVAVSPAH
ncbi:MAG TPA: hypothetical protein VHX36_01500 [Candidatus Acidoferrales bacterium]|jgi:hypothetical protein|nr:hypothetical protein [Candidatus Acidoferrales bacterium]